MQEVFCPLEDSVLLAIRTGQWGETLRGHVSACPQCKEVAQVAGWMADVAERLGSEGTLLDPTLAWLKAQLEEHQHVQERRLRRAAIQHALVRSRRVGCPGVVAALVVAVRHRCCRSRKDFLVRSGLPLVDHYPPGTFRELRS